MRKKTSISLRQLESEIEPRKINSITCQYVRVIEEAFGDKINTVLGALIEKKPLKMRMITQGLEQEITEEADENIKKKLGDASEAIKNLSSLLSENHPVISDLLNFRKAHNFNETRTGEVPIATWAAAESQKTLESLQQQISVLPSVIIDNRSANVLVTKTNDLGSKT